VELAPEVRLHDTVRLRKPHPCGESRWRVVRVGADVGLTCLGCGRHVLLSRHAFDRRLKGVLDRADATGVSQPS
jgi:hypothetical protein